MDIYLPADFHALRDDLYDWREESDRNASTADVRDNDADAAPDPNWKAL